jgi:hypothetical protein
MARDNGGKKFTTRNFAIREDQDALLLDLAERSGLSVSFVLRYILDDWRALGREIPSLIVQSAPPAERLAFNVKGAQHHGSVALTEKYAETVKE